jgi:hypothetical protein
MDVDFKNPPQILANQIQQCVKRIIDHSQVEFIPCMQDGSILESQLINFINKLKKKSHNHINRYRKGF